MAGMATIAKSDSRSSMVPVDDEAALIAAIRAGGTGAAESYDRLYRMHHDAVLRLARRLCRDRYEADDVTSEVFCNTLRAVSHGHGPSDELRAYLLRSTRNTVTKLRTRTDTARAVPTPDEHLDRPTAPDDGDGGSAGGGAALEAFGDITERFREVIWATEVDGATSTELADCRRITAPAAASLAYRARRALRRAYLTRAADARSASGACARIRGQLPALLVGDLGVRRSGPVTEHLEECPQCREVRDHLAATEARFSRRGWWMALTPSGLRVLLGTGGRSLLGVVGMTPAAAVAAVTVTASVALAGDDPVRSDIAPSPAAPAPAAPPELDERVSSDAPSPASTPATAVLDETTPVPPLLPVIPAATGSAPTGVQPDRRGDGAAATTEGEAPAAPAADAPILPDPLDPNAPLDPVRTVVTVVGVATSTVDGVVGAATSTVDGVAGGLPPVDAATDVVDAVADVATSSVDDVAGSVEGLPSGTPVGDVGGVAKDVLGPAAGDVVDAVGGAAGDVAGAVTPIAPDVGGAVGDLVGAGTDPAAPSTGTTGAGAPPSGLLGGLTGG